MFLFATIRYSWRSLTSNKLEKLESKFEKIIGILKQAGKVRKVCSPDKTFTGSPTALISLIPNFYLPLFLEGCPCKNPFWRPCIPWVKNDSCPTNKCTMLVQLWL